MTLDMTQGKPRTLLLQFALPMMMGNLFQQLYNLVDTAVVGRFIGSDALAAVGTTGNVTFFLFTWIMGLCNGAGIIIAQYWGMKNYKEMRGALAALVKITVVLVVIISLAGVFLSPAILRLIQVPKDILPYSVTYIRICTSLILFSAAYNACAAFLRSIGDSKTPFTAMVISSVVNVVFDLLFVVVFPLGVAGVAMATILAQFVSAAYCFLHILRHKEALHLTGFSLKDSKGKFALICQIGIPTALQSCMISLGGMSVQGLVNSFGTSVMAAYTTAQRIDSVTIQIIVALGSAMSVFTGQNIGRMNFKRIKEGLHNTLLLMSLSSILLAVAVLLFRIPLLTIFLNPETDREAIQFGSQYLSIIGIAYIIAGVMNSYLNVIRGAGDVVTSIAAGFAELFGRIFFAFFLTGTVGLGTWGIWLATPLSWGCGCIIPVIRYYSGRWQTKGIMQKQSEPS